MQSVGIGVIGVGVMGADHVNTITSRIPGASVKSIFDADQGKADSLGAAVGAEVATSTESLIGDPSIHGVIVAAPDPLHEELLLACLRVGKPVLCEKPLAIDSAGSRRIVEAECVLGRRIVQVGFMRRYDPALRALRMSIDDGAIGTVRLLHCLHRNVAAQPSATSAGVVSNSMIHELDQVPWLLASPLTAITVVAPRVGKVDGDLLDTQVALLETESGAMATVEVSVNAHYGYDVRVEAVGETGTARLSSPYGIELRKDARDGANVTSDWVGRFSDAYRAELADWVASLRTGVPTGPSAWDGHLATTAAEAGVSSLRTGTRSEIHPGKRPAIYDH